jgi:hypothetical protein
MMRLDFTMVALREEDKSWGGLERDWSRQAEQLGQPPDSYGSASLSVLRDLAAGRLATVGGAHGMIEAAGIRHKRDGRFYAACMLNLAELPGVPGLSLRVRHLVESPLLDSGVRGPDFYSDALISTLGTISHFARSRGLARHVRVHFQKPADASLVRACEAALIRADVSGSVQMHGAWLYISRI